jgi:hypothetical protein
MIRVLRGIVGEWMTSSSARLMTLFEPRRFGLCLSGTCHRAGFGASVDFLGLVHFLAVALV